MDFNRMKEISDKISKTEKLGIFEPTIRELNKRAKLLTEVINNQFSQPVNSEPEEETTEDRTLPGTELNFEMEKFKNAFHNYNVTFEFEQFMIVNGGIFWAGTIDNQIQWIYKVTEDDETSGVDLNFAPEFNPDEEDNKKIIQLIQSYYNEFYRYWRDNALSDSGRPSYD